MMVYALGKRFGTALDHVAGELGGIGQEFGAAGDMPHVRVHDLLDLVIKPCDLAAAGHVREQLLQGQELAGKVGEGYRGVAACESLQLAFDRGKERRVGRPGVEQRLRHLLADRAVDHAPALLGIGECSAGAQGRDHPDGRDHRRVAACGLADALRSLRGVLDGLLDLRWRHRPMQSMTSARAGTAVTRADTKSAAPASRSNRKRFNMQSIPANADRLLTRRRPAVR
jgi:hypothetical protein